MTTYERGSANRKADHPVDPLFVDRWSPRAMTGEPIETSTLLTLFEAARWAPSSGNLQPWRFLYAPRESGSWRTFLGLLNEKNRRWASKAAVLLVVVSQAIVDGKPRKTSSFDTGAAWMSLALQGSKLGLVVHGMAGFDFDRARAELAVPDDFRVEAMVAIGKHGDPADLPEDLQAREKPSDRRPVDQSAREGPFPDDRFGR